MKHNMRVESFKVLNFRSIEAAEIPLADLTAMVGPNNEGKSNILRALVAAMSLLLGEGSAMPSGLRRRAWPPAAVFDPERDAPYNRPTSNSRVEIRLQLDDRECEEFHEEIGNRINGDLRFEVNFTARGPGKIKIVKQKSGPALTDKTREIAAFISRRLRFEYVGAIRTADQALGVVQRLVLDQLRVLSKDDEYYKALEQIRKLEEPLLEQISEDVRDSLREFLPDVREVIISKSERSFGFRPIREAVEVLVDDGVPTDLAAKGDGVQSLAAIALMRRAAASGAEDRHLVLAVEEPETHLHPGAVRRLRGVLREISQQHQVVITTHSPLLIDTEKPAGNVIVLNSRAKPADKVSDIRECLGVEIGDNLTSARLVLLVEGDGDVKVIRAVLAAKSKLLRELLDKNELALVAVGGASQLSAFTSAMRASACSVFVVVDGDTEGRAAVEKALASGRITAADYRLVARRDLQEAELEDLLLASKAKAEIDRELGVSLKFAAFSRGGPKFTDKLTGLLRSVGKLGNQSEVATVKRLIAECVVADPLSHLRKEGHEWFDGLVSALEGRLS